MIETTLAAGDLITAIPTLWESVKVPLSIVVIIAGIGAGIAGMSRGFGHAAGKLIGGIALAAIVLGAVGISTSLKQSLDHHGQCITCGSYGN
jgi:hypothetical protein